MAPEMIKEELDVLIIGCGPSGAISLRNILVDRRIKNVLCVERNTKPGGLWLNHIPRYSSLQVLKSEWELHGVTVDPAEPDRRASADSICRWVQDYVNRWELNDYIRLGTEVVSCVEIGDGWEAVLHNMADGTTTTYQAKSVMVCTGLENIPRIANFPGQETATMPIVHNLSIRDKSELPDNEVLVVGCGPSSMDILQEACRNGTKRVYGAHRKAHLGLPDSFGISEMALFRFMFQTMRFPDWVVRNVVNALSFVWSVAINGIDAWKPVELDINKDIAYAFRSELVSHVRSGRLKPMVSSIVKIDGDAVHMSTGEILHPEMIVCATGWHLDFTYLPTHDGIEFEDLQKRLYSRFMDIKHKNLFFVSIANGFMCASHNADIVSRCVIQILTGDWVRPAKGRLQDNINNVVLKGVALPGKYEMELEKEGFVNKV